MQNANADENMPENDVIVLKQTYVVITLIIVLKMIICT